MATSQVDLAAHNSPAVVRTLMTHATSAFNPSCASCGWFMLPWLSRYLSSCASVAWLLATMASPTCADAGGTRQGPDFDQVPCTASQFRLATR